MAIFSGHRWSRRRRATDFEINRARKLRIIDLSHAHYALTNCIGCMNAHIFLRTTGNYSNMLKSLVWENLHERRSDNMEPRSHTLSPSKFYRSNERKTENISLSGIDITAMTRQIIKRNREEKTSGTVLDQRPPYI